MCEPPADSIIHLVSFENILEQLLLQYTLLHHPQTTNQFQLLCNHSYSPADANPLDPRDLEVGIDVPTRVTGPEAWGIGFIMGWDSVYIVFFFSFHPI